MSPVTGHFESTVVLVCAHGHTHTHTVYSLINPLDCDDNRTLTWTDCHLSHWVNSHFVLLYLLITELQGCLTLYLFIFMTKKRKSLC